MRTYKVMIHPNNKQEMKVDNRTYKCEKCGLILDRDLNAAINLVNYVDIK